MEKIYSERNVFAEMVRELVTMDLQNIGIQLLSFTLKEITDEVEYLASLGRCRIAEVKQEAAIGVASADKDCCIKRAEAKRTVQEAKFRSEGTIEHSQKILRLAQCEHEQIISKRRVEAELSYELRLAQLRKELIKKQLVGQQETLVKKYQILEWDAKARKHRLDAEIIATAEAEAYRLKQFAVGRSAQIKAQAEAEAQRVRLLATAQKDSIKLIGEAEAEQTMARASSFKTYKEAALLQLTLKALPKMAAEICAPLSKVHEIVMVSGSAAGSGLAGNFSAETAQLASELPPTLKALTGLDFGRLLASASMNNNPNPAIGGSAEANRSFYPANGNVFLTNNLPTGGNEAGAGDGQTGGGNYALMTPMGHVTPVTQLGPLVTFGSQPNVCRSPFRMRGGALNESNDARAAIDVIEPISSSLGAIASGDFGGDRQSFGFAHAGTSISGRAFADSSVEGAASPSDISSQSDAISLSGSAEDLAVQIESGKKITTSGGAEKQSERNAPIKKEDSDKSKSRKDQKEPKSLKVTKSEEKNKKDKKEEKKEEQKEKTKEKAKEKNKEK